MTAGKVQRTSQVTEGPVDRREQVVIHDHGDYEHHERVVEDIGQERRLLLQRIVQLIYLFFGVLEGLIGLRVLLKVIAANPANPFARFIYALTDLFLLPFAGLVGNPSAEGMVLEITALIGMFVYALLCWLIVRLVWLTFYRSSARSVETYEKERQ
jgi:hypothetical protein